MNSDFCREKSTIFEELPTIDNEWVTFSVIQIQDPSDDDLVVTTIEYILCAAFKTGCVVRKQRNAIDSDSTFQILKLVFSLLCKSTG